MRLVSSSVSGGVGRLRLTRPDKRNALTHAMVDEVIEAMDAFAAAGAAVAVLEADPPVFCAGNDLREARADRDRAAAERILGALLERPLHWIAAVEGPALGAGVAVVAACPVAIASEDAWFSLPEITIGLFPAGVTPYLEPLIGLREAHTAGLSGERLPAAAVARLVTETVPPGEVHDRVDAWAEHLVANPQVAAAGRESWQRRFRTAAFTERRDSLDEILRAQSFAREEAAS